MGVSAGIVAAIVSVAGGGDGPLQHLWTDEYNGPGNNTDQVADVVAAPNGDLVVAGGSTESGFDQDILVSRYSPSGSLLWRRHWDSPTGGNDYTAAAKFDAQGNLLIGGYYYGGPAGTTFAILKYDGAGNLLWWKNYWITSGGSAGHVTEDLAVDQAGNAYLVGSTWLGIGPGNMVIVKYDANGVFQWVRQFNGTFGGWDQGLRVVVDNSQNIVVTGRTEVAQYDDDIAIWKYNASGDLLWFRSFGHPSGGWDQASGIAIAPGDEVRICGYSYLCCGSDARAVVISYDADGDFMWEYAYDGSVGDEDRFHSMTIDGAGNTYATGHSKTVEQYQDFLTVKVDPSGAPVWVRLFGEPVEAFDEATHVEIDDRGFITVAGTSQHLLPPDRKGGGKGPPLENGWRFLSYDPSGTLRYEQFETIEDTHADHSFARAAALPGGRVAAGGGFYEKSTQGNIWVAAWQEDHDCNGNGIPDSVDIANGLLTDADGSGVADECEAAGDLDGSGGVAAGDLAIVLGAWGNCENCPADLNNDGVVDAVDLALVIGGWTG